MGVWSSKTRLSAEDMQFLQTKTQLDQASIEVKTVSQSMCLTFYRERPSVKGVILSVLKGALCL